MRHPHHGNTILIIIIITSPSLVIIILIIIIIIILFPPCQVTVLSTSPSKEAEARELGAHHFVVSKSNDAMRVRPSTLPRTPLYHGNHHHEFVVTITTTASTTTTTITTTIIIIIFIIIIIIMTIKPPRVTMTLLTVGRRRRTRWTSSSTRSRPSTPSRPTSTSSAPTARSCWCVLSMGAHVAHQRLGAAYGSCAPLTARTRIAFGTVQSNPPGLRKTRVVPPLPRHQATPSSITKPNLQQ
jgi:hypothetical protein